MVGIMQEVKHVGTWGTRTTNYVEWVNDVSDSNDFASAGLI